MDRWRDALQVVLTGALTTAWTAWATREPGTTLVVALLVLLAAWLLSPVAPVGPHTPHAAAQAAAGDDDLVAYWRPGCSYCLLLAYRLPRAARRRITWVHVLRDREAEAFVRSVRDGDMVTPTVVTGAGEVLPAEHEDVLAHLG